MSVLLASGGLVVVETEDDIVLGIAEVVGEQVVVRNGYRGHPTVISLNDVERVTPATEHPDIEAVAIPRQG